MQQVRRVVKFSHVLRELFNLMIQLCRLGREIAAAPNSDDISGQAAAAVDATTSKQHSTVSEKLGGNAAASKAIVYSLRPILEPQLAEKYGLTWTVAKPHLETMCDLEQLQDALSDPEAFVHMLVSNPVIKKMIIDGLRQVLEPIVILREGLTWKIVADVLEAVTGPDKIEALVAEPAKIFDELLATGGPVAKVIFYYDRSAQTENLSSVLIVEVSCCQVLLRMLAPKLTPLCNDERLQWALVQNALLSFATVEMLALALETPGEFFEAQLWKLEGIVGVRRDRATGSTALIKPGEKSSAGIL
jgi:hypothetical protein